MRTIHRLCFGSLLLLSLALPVWAQERKAGTGRYDQQIQEQVTRILGSKSKWKDITASTEDGIVTLQGSVKLYIDKADAGKKADRVEHVEGVRNHIAVEGNVPDAQLQEKVADKLRYDRIGQGITFNSLTLQVQNGVVTVGGDVIDYPSRDSAIAIVATTPGVKDVIDEINVLPVSNFDDDLRIRIARAIYGNSSLQKYATDPQKPIRIVVKSGKVTLYGVVDNQMDKQIAEVQAKSVPGAFSVDNQLIVAKQQKK